MSAMNTFTCSDNSRNPPIPREGTETCFFCVHYINHAFVGTHPYLARGRKLTSFCVVSSMTLVGNSPSLARGRKLHHSKGQSLRYKCRKLPKPREGTETARLYILANFCNDVGNYLSLARGRKPKYLFWVFDFFHFFL